MYLFSENENVERKCNLFTFGARPYTPRAHMVDWAKMSGKLSVTKQFMKIVWPGQEIKN